MKTLSTNTDLFFRYTEGNPFLDLKFRKKILTTYRKAGEIRGDVESINLPEGLYLQPKEMDHHILVLQYEANSNGVCIVHQTPLGHVNLEMLCKKLIGIKKKSINIV